MRGSSTTGSVLSLPMMFGIAILAACNAADETRAITFRVEVDLHSDTSQVLADGVAQPIITNNEGFPVVDFSRTYPNYQAAEDASPITFEFTSNGALTNVGYTAPGVCAKFCLGPQCPIPTQIIEERLDVMQGDFIVNQFSCIQCNTTTTIVGVCN